MMRNWATVKIDNLRDDLQLWLFCFASILEKIGEEKSILEERKCFSALLETISLQNIWVCSIGREKKETNSVISLKMRARGGMFNLEGFFKKE